MSVLPPIEEKAVYVERMFARIAPGYDQMNRIITFGLDQRWRETAVQLIAPPAAGRALDVGSGTGDFLIPLRQWIPYGLSVGIDYTVAMLHEGHAKIKALGPQAVFSAADALRLPFADNSFDVVTTGFVMRNVTDIDQAFREMWRVTRPGGQIACLEVGRPRNPLFRLGHRIYFERIVPLIAGALGADTTAYTYLPQSARNFPPPDSLKIMLEQAGWSDVSYRLLGLGAAALHLGRKR